MELPVVAVMELPPAALKVYAAVVLLAGGEARQITVRSVASVSGLSERTVYRWLPWLVDGGWLEKHDQVETLFDTGQREASVLAVVR